VAVEVLQKFWQAPLDIGDDGVYVIGHRAKRMQLYAGALGRYSETVGDDLIGLS